MKPSGFEVTATLFKQYVRTMLRYHYIPQFIFAFCRLLLGAVQNLAKVLNACAGVSLRNYELR